MSAKIDFLGIVRFRISISLIENDLAALSLSGHDRLLRSQLKQFRQEYHSTFSNKENLTSKREDIFDLFRKLWSVLCSLAPDHCLYLPPIYSTPKIKKIFQEFIESYLLREQGETLDSGNMVLGGIEGIGKTTVAKAMILAVNLLSVRYILLFFDYKYIEVDRELLPSIDDLVNEFHLRWADCNFEAEHRFGSLPMVKKRILDDVLNDLWQNGEGIGIGCVIDEVQELYHSTSGDSKIASSNNGVSKKFNLLRRIETFGRRFPRAFFVLTGSSSDLHYALFQKGKNEVGEYIVDFNRSLSDFYHVEALRSTELLREYLKQRYGMKDQSESELCHLLYCTGGIGRKIHNLVLRQRMLFTPLSEEVVSAAIAVYHDPQSWLFLIVAQIQSYNSTEMEALRNYWRTKDPNDLTLRSSFGVDYNSLVPVLINLGVKNVQFLIYRLVDQGFIYVSADNRVEVAIPAMLEIFASSISNEDFFLFSAVLAMVYSPEQINAGKALEKFLLPRLSKWRGFLFCPYLGNSVILRDGEVIIATANDIATTITSLTAFCEFAGQLLTWRNETGVDGLQFFYDKSRRCLSFDFWQSKGGHLKATIGGGEIATYLKTYQEEETVEHVRDDIFAGIAVKGFVGVLTLMKAFAPLLPPRHTIKVRNFILTTTKEARVAKEKYNNKSIKIPAGLIQKFQLQKIFPEGLSIKAMIFDKTNWFVDLLEPNLQNLLPVKNTDEKATTSNCIIS